MSLIGKVAIVTGAGSGIGRACAVRIASSKTLLNDFVASPEM